MLQRRVILRWNGDDHRIRNRSDFWGPNPHSKAECDFARFDRFLQIRPYLGIGKLHVLVIHMEDTSVYKHSSACSIILLS